MDGYLRSMVRLKESHMICGQTDRFLTRHAAFVALKNNHGHLSVPTTNNVLLSKSSVRPPDHELLDKHYHSQERRKCWI